MRLHNLDKVDHIEIEDWIIKNIHELTPFQKERMGSDEFVRFSGYEFYKRGKKVNNIFLRLSIVAILPAVLISIIGLPINFIITGNWGYGDGISWLETWIRRCGF